MTLFVSVRKCWTVRTVTYALVSVVCVVFNLVYTAFSYGQSSPFMQWMFLLPAVLGLLPSAVLALIGKGTVSRVAFNLWNSAVAVLVFGCLVRGIVNISGRFTDYDWFYWVAGVLFLVSAVAAQIISRVRSH